jgi:spermidine/putrescine transport system permease protein
VNGSTNTFPTWVYGASRLGEPPQVNVWGTVLFTVGIVVAVLQVVRTRRQSSEA